MPELPEVETTRRGITPYVIQKRIKKVILRQRSLRWPIPATLPAKLKDEKFVNAVRRGKYLLLSTDKGTLIIHLGMSGSLRILGHNTPAEKHDHVDIVFSNGSLLRFRDPRRFGAMLWTTGNAMQHKLLRDLGVEPLENDFTADYLHQISRNRKLAIKQLIMDSHIVVGVGNIYANEALFLAGIRPTTSAKRISHARMVRLTDAIKLVLLNAIKSGGTTLRDFTREDGNPGYFQQKLNVYGQVNEACPVCQTTIKLVRQSQRASYYCPNCQR